jgi:hypothetical protein
LHLPHQPQLPQQSSAYQILTAAQEAMVTDHVSAFAAIASVAGVTALARCIGPRGAYATEIRSARGDRLLFRQTFPDRPSFVAVVNGAQAWSRDEVTGDIERLDMASVEGLRSHEFQMIALTMPDRYADAEWIASAEFAGRTCQVVQLLDRLGQPCRAYFADDDGLWAGMTLPDSRVPEREAVRVVINQWRRVGGVLLPVRVTATDAVGDFVLDFHTVTFNDVDDTLFALPPGPAAATDASPSR